MPKFSHRCWILLVVALLCACSTPQRHAGCLLLVGGGLDNDQVEVYGRLLELAGRASDGPAPRLAIVTAATGPQHEEATDKAQALHAFCSRAEVTVAPREASTAATIAAIERAGALFFTGGDQERITARYRPDGADSSELQAMRRLLARGGTIAGASAGDAMMGHSMFAGGSSARALGVPGSEPPHGPQLVPGMGFLPWALTDSHFFERDRIGRLGAALVASGTRLGIGVGEDAAVEIDLASGVLVGLTTAESLLVDAAAAVRDGPHLRGFVAQLLPRGVQRSLPDRLNGPLPRLAPRPDGPTHVVPIVPPGQNRQLASWRLFRRAAAEPGLWRLELDGWQVVAWSNGGGEVVFDLEVR